MTQMIGGVPESIVQDVVLKSARRCALCYAEGKDEPQPGVIAHIDGNEKNNEPDNLIFLCFAHRKIVRSPASTVSRQQMRLARTRLHTDVEAVSPSARASTEEVEEAVFRRLEDEFIAAHGSDTVEVSSRRVFQGHSGMTYEIDVVMEMTLAAGLRLLIAVEVKHIKRRIGAAEVMAFAAKLDDIGAHKGIFVATSDYTRSALDFARAKGISLVKFGAITTGTGRWATVIH